MRPVGILCIHGIGSQVKGWSDVLERGVRKQLGPNYPLQWEESLWSPITQKLCDAAYNAIRPHTHDDPLKRFLFQYAADALAYQRPPRVGAVDIYAQMHKVLDDAMNNLRYSDPELPVIVVSHSLGTVVATNWLWDNQATIKVQGLITMGSPIPMFIGGLLMLDPVSVPRWWNIYDRLDPIGAPLKVLSPAFSLAVTHDIAVKNNSWWEKWKVIRKFVHAHIDYDYNTDVHTTIARMVREVASEEPVA